ncbi:uncharacterized protein METZ01_LOCUS31660 [marine metagenome]|uniref:Uncharacterized protein n=1 Tax=marine metagenome TaxID=408172 RepID=A0A381QHK7_9ZZZZ
MAPEAGESCIGPVAGPVERRTFVALQPGFGAPAEDQVG